jgi:hypothetical protein
VNKEEKGQAMRKNISIIILVIIILAGAFFYFKKNKSEPAGENLPAEAPKDNFTPVSVKTENIKEDNFTGKVAVISGSSEVAVQAQAYADEQVTAFREQANTDVPPMRAQYGTDSPTANYEIQIDAKYTKGLKTESVVLNAYTYTGGAHGSSWYKVFTASLPDGKILDLSDVVKDDQRAAFTAFVKKELAAWRPEGSTAAVTFPEDVEALTFDSFTEWSLDDKALTIYFSQYEIGPGALGAVPFALPLTKARTFLDASFL